MFLESANKAECFGCEACVQACERHALSMAEDEEGFRYPVVDKTLCTNCGQCLKTCPHENVPQKHENNKYVFGGYNVSDEVRFDSTSGGAFSAIVDAYCDADYVIFGAEAKALQVFHGHVFDKKEIGKFRKSKYSQSNIGLAYKNARLFLKDGKKVLFSGTPCQISGLLAFLGDIDKTKLLTVEVICEGVPSPLYVRKMDDALYKRHGSHVDSIDYRYTGKSFFSGGKWDFEQMRIELPGKSKAMIKDRWFNPFWSIWLQHLMSRPSCYQCQYNTTGRVADVTLGDLWGVHLYCPDLYGNNKGASLVICNTKKGKEVFLKASKNMIGRELKFEEALKYQSPLKRQIGDNPKRSEFMLDLQSNMEFAALNKKWAIPPGIKLLFQKYLWGNRQKIFVWNIMHKATRKQIKEGKEENG